LGQYAGTLALNALMTLCLYAALWLKRHALQGGTPLTWADRVTLVLPLLMWRAQDPQPLLALCLQGTGWGLCLWSLTQLSPGTLATTGPYRWVRHPMYTGYLLWIGGAMGGQPYGGFNTLVWLWLLWGLHQRLRREETALQQSDLPYASYCQTTRYRLLPGVY
jgi:Isoprenylcysteine carboxyl methyltransferase (ICMT) family